MEATRMDGIAHQVKGRLKQTFGKLIGDAKLTADGAAERAVGDSQNIAGGPLITGIDADRVSGVGRQIKGAGAQVLGRLFGDKKMAADGSADRAAGKAQNEAGSARDEAREIGKAASGSAHVVVSAGPDHDAPRHDAPAD
jgi:uncharacterized protein YjbJ (UPF0337 family)